jgi:2-polyprenyl-3-methyl-5-hydroxy-6-metoxy-1,4-benzoquinol methylase
MMVRKFILEMVALMFSVIPMKWRWVVLLKIFRRSVADLPEFAPVSRDENMTEKRIAVLKGLLALDNELYKAISLSACKYDDGIHPKHRLMKYHDFFCKNIDANESVLDIGCGNGFLTSDVAKCTCGRVVGIDINKDNIDFAKNHYRANNIAFICGDVKTDIEQAHFDAVILSNVLEHLPERAKFLRQVLEKVSPSKFLLRVPMYEREWMVPLKEELGIDYMLDATHKIEYTQEQFFQELGAAGLAPETWEIRWGEIWCRAKPK